MSTEKYIDKKAEEKTDNLFKAVFLCRGFVNLFDIGNKIAEKRNTCTKKCHNSEKSCRQCNEIFCAKCSKNRVALYNLPSGTTLTYIKDLCSCCISGNLLITAYIDLKNKISGKNVPITPEDVLKEMMDNEDLDKTKKDIEKAKKDIEKSKSEEIEKTKKKALDIEKTKKKALDALNELRKAMDSLGKKIGE